MPRTTTARRVKIQSFYGAAKSTLKRTRNDHYPHLTNKIKRSTLDTLASIIRSRVQLLGKTALAVCGGNSQTLTEESVLAATSILWPSRVDDIKAAFEEKRAMILEHLKTPIEDRQRIVHQALVKLSIPPNLCMSQLRCDRVGKFRSSKFAKLALSIAVGDIADHLATVSHDVVDTAHARKPSQGYKSLSPWHLKTAILADAELSEIFKRDVIKDSSVRPQLSKLLHRHKKDTDDDQN